jgi:hypothetical protein
MNESNSYSNLILGECRKRGWVMRESRDFDSGTLECRVKKPGICGYGSDISSAGSWKDVYEDLVRQGLVDI